MLKWAYDNNPADYSETSYACCGVERERGRDGVAIDYMHDGVGRVTSAIRNDGIMENTEYDGLVTRVTRSPVSPWPPGTFRARSGQAPAIGHRAAPGRPGNRGNAH